MTAARRLGIAMIAAVALAAPGRRAEAKPPPPAPEKLVRQLETGQVNARREAAIALAQQPEQAAPHLAAIKAALAKEENQYVRAAIENAIAKIEALNRKAEPPPAPVDDTPPGRPRLAAQFGDPDAYAGGTTFAAVTPDGKWAVTAGDTVARLWDTATGKEIRRFVHPDNIEAWPFAAAVALSPDGRLLLTGCRDKAGRLWDLKTGAMLFRLEPAKVNPWRGHGALFVAFGAGGKLAVTADGGAVRLWDTATGKPAGEFESPCRSVALSPDGKLVLTGEEKTACLRSADGTKVRDLPGHTDTVTCAAFSPDGKRALTGGWDGSARLWDVATGRQLHKFDHDGHVKSVAFRPDGKQVITLEGRWVRIWDADTGAQAAKVGFNHEVSQARFTPDGNQFITAGSGKKQSAARIWNPENGEPVRNIGEEKRGFAGVSPGNVLSVGFAAGDRRIFTAFQGGGRVWDVEKNRLVSKFARDGMTSAVGAISSDGRRVLLSGYHDAYLVDADTGERLHTLSGHTGEVGGVTFSPDGSRIATASWDHTAKLWDPATGRELRKFQDIDMVHSVAVGPDNRSVLTAAKFVRLWNADTGAEVEVFLTDSKWVWCTAFSPDGRRVYAEEFAWDAKTGNGIRRFREEPKYWPRVELSRDGRRLILSNEEEADIFDTATGKAIAVLKAAPEKFHSAALSADGKRALTGGYDGAARLWDVDAGKELCRLIAFSDDTWAVTDADGRYDGSDDGRVPWLHWVVDNKPVELAAFRDRFHDPGLLGKYLGLDKRPVRAVKW